MRRAPLTESTSSRDDQEEVTLLDNRSVRCAVGIIRVARLLQDLPEGSLVEVWSRDRFAPFEIPIRVENDGHQVILQQRVGKWPRRYYRFLIRRGTP